MDQISCSPIASHYELTVIALNRLATYNARRVYVCLEFELVESSDKWIARAYLAPKEFAERIAGKLAGLDGIVTRLREIK